MNKIIERNIGRIVALLAIVSYFELFKLTAFPYIIRQFSQVIVMAMMFILIIIKIIYSQERPVKMNFAVPIILLMIGALPSYFVAAAYHGQNLLISLYANRIIWFYLLYFFVHFYKVSPRFLLRLVILTGLFAVVLYYIQFYMFPQMIMEINFQTDRGTIRLFVAGLICTQAAYFYFLKRFFAKNRIIYLVFALLCLSVFILQGTRQIIFALIFLSLVYVLLARRIRSRTFVSFIFITGAITLFFLFREIFIELTEVSATQVRSLGEGVRLKAAKFFITDFMPNIYAYLFGNGNSGLSSRYNQEMMMYVFKNGYYVSDIGLLGDYVKYGIVFITAGIYLIIKGLTFKISNNIDFLKFYIFLQCFTVFTGYGFLGGVDIIMLLILYVFDVDRAEQTEAKEDTVANLKYKEVYS